MNPSAGSKYSRCKGPLDLGSGAHGVLGCGKLKQRVDLEAGASAERDIRPRAVPS